MKKVYFDALVRNEVNASEKLFVWQQIKTVQWQ